MGPKHAGPSTPLTRDRTEILILLLWTHLKSAAYRPLSRNVIREIGSFFPLSSSFLVKISPDALSFFDCRLRKWLPEVQLKRHLGAFYYSDMRALILENGKVLCTGEVNKQAFCGLPSKDCNCVLSKTGVVESLPSMVFRRYRQGMAEYAGCVYVFGGFRKRYIGKGYKPDPSNACEKISYERTPSKWQPVPRMSEGRADFNPCLYGECIYVCGLGSVLIESFALRGGAFMRLNVKLPENSACCLVVCAGKLTVFTSRYVLRYQREGTKLKEVGPRAQPHEAWEKASPCSPVLDRATNRVYLLVGAISCSFSAETGCREPEYMASE